MNTVIDEPGGRARVKISEDGTKVGTKTHTDKTKRPVRGGKDGVKKMPKVASSGTTDEYGE